jgi:hypothetical protein
MRAWYAEILMTQQKMAPVKGMETAVETALGALCVAANLTMPCVVDGVYMYSAAWGVFCAAILMALVLVNLWLVYRSKRKLEKKGLRHNGAIRVIAVLLVIGSAFNACVFTPLVAWHMAELDTWNKMNHRKTAFEHAVLQVNFAYLDGDGDVYPANLKNLLSMGPPIFGPSGEKVNTVKLAWYFPDATPAEVKEVEILAEAVKTREPTAAEAELIERAAHVKYVGEGLAEKDQIDDYLVLISLVEVEGKILLGYSTGRVDHVLPGAVAGVISKENAKRAKRGLPAITWPQGTPGKGQPSGDAMKGR